MQQRTMGLPQAAPALIPENLTLVSNFAARRATRWASQDQHVTPRERLFQSRHGSQYVPYNSRTSWYVQYRRYFLLRPRSDAGTTKNGTKSMN